MKHEITYNGWTHEDILEQLSEAVNVLDKNERSDLADTVFDIMVALKTEWKIDLN